MLIVIGYITVILLYLSVNMMVRAVQDLSCHLICLDLNLPNRKKDLD